MRRTSLLALMLGVASVSAANVSAQKNTPANGSAGASQTGAAAPTPTNTGTPGATSQTGGKGTVTFYREIFSYSGNGRRDPFVSLMASDEGGIRPLLVDLSVIGIIYDHTGRNSIATVVDGTNAKVYNIHVGSILGRMKVLKIDQGSITLNLDEFGFSRQETLLLSTPTRAAGRRP